MRLHVRQRRRARHSFVDSGLCRSCAKPIIGGKGDYWHRTSPYPGYGPMAGPDGHLAYPLQVGDRITLTEPMSTDPVPVPVGTSGTVRSITVFSNTTVIGMDWDDGRTLNVITPPDCWQRWLP